MKPRCLRILAPGLGSGENVGVLKWGNRVFIPKIQVPISGRAPVWGGGVVEDILLPCVEEDAPCVPHSIIPHAGPEVGAGEGKSSPWSLPLPEPGPCPPLSD